SIVPVTPAPVEAPAADTDPTDHSFDRPPVRRSFTSHLEPLTLSNAARGHAGRPRAADGYERVCENRSLPESTTCQWSPRREASHASHAATRDHPDRRHHEGARRTAPGISPRPCQGHRLLGQLSRHP